jgi:DNA-binding response OmpR family regulator
MELKPDLFRDKRILLVEDNPKDEALTLRALQKHNLTAVVVMRDGVEALDYLLGPPGGAAQQPLPQLVLLDLKLPKVDGLEVLRRLRDHERTRLLPVVILTSSTEECDVIEGYRLGTNSYVRKPVDFAEFSDVVRQLGLYWLVVNTMPPAL